MLYFLLFLLIPLVLIGLVWVAFHRIWRGNWLFNSLNFILFEIRFPKILENGAPNQNRCNLLAMESFYDSLRVMKAHFVFEIVKLENSEDISFYVAFPKKFYTVVKNQLMRFFPDAEMEPISNFNISNGNKALAGSSLKLKYDRIPFPTYKNLNASAIDTMTKTMASLRKENAVVFQIIIKPLEKGSFKANVRIASLANTEDDANQNLSEIESAFSQFEDIDTNGFYSFRPQAGAFNKFIRNFHLRLPDKKAEMRLTTEELTSIFHWPIIKMEVPQIRSLKARSAPPPMITSKGGIVLGKNYFRGETTVIKMPFLDRRRHLFVAGQPGLGKKRFLKNLIHQDIRNGTGFGVIDLQGDLIGNIIDLIPSWRHIEQSLDADISDVVKNGKIFLADLSKNGTDRMENAALASVLINKFHKIALERSEKSGRIANRDFYLYVNEVDRSNVDQIAKIIAKTDGQRHNINLIMSGSSVIPLPETTSLVAFRPDFGDGDTKIFDENHAHAKLFINDALTMPFNIEIEEWK